MKTPQQAAEEHTSNIVNLDDDRTLTGHQIKSFAIKDFLAGYSVAMEWVRVEDRLPDISNAPSLSDGKTYHHNHAIKVIAYSPSTIGITTAYYWGENNDPMNGWSLLGVTHWQPLPSPPSQKENNLKTK